MDDLLNNNDQEKYTILLFLDLSAAFYTVDHDILLSWLRNIYVITDTMLNMIDSYLLGRVFYVVT